MPSVLQSDSVSSPILSDSAYLTIAPPTIAVVVVAVEALPANQIARGCHCATRVESVRHSARVDTSLVGPGDLSFVCCDDNDRVARWFVTMSRTAKEVAIIVLGFGSRWLSCKLGGHHYATTCHSAPESCKAGSAGWIIINHSRR